MSKRNEAASESICTRFSPEAVRAIDIARNTGLFKRSRSEFLRDCVSHYIQTHSHVKAEVEKEIGKV